MSVTSLGANSLDSSCIIAKPPIAYKAPPKVTKLMELLSWGNSGIISHLKVESKTEVKHTLEVL